MHFPVHFLDRFFLFTQDRSPAPACMWAFELEAAELDQKRLEQALLSALVLHPKATVRLRKGRGAFGAPEWEAVPELSAGALVVHPATFGAGETLHAALVEMMNTPLEPAQGSLVRLHWLPRPGERAVLCFRFHHAIADGYGSLALLRDVLAIYGGAEPERPAPPPALVPGSLRTKLGLFKELVLLHLRQSLRSRFAVPEKLFAVEARSRQRFAFSERLLSPDRMDRYRRALTRSGASFNDLFVAAWALAIGRWLEQDGKACGLLRLTINQKLRDPRFGLETLSSSFPVWVRDDERNVSESLVRSVRAQVRECLRRRIARATLLFSALLKLPFPLARWLFRPLLLKPRLSDSLIISNLDGATSLLEKVAGADFGRISVAHPLVVPPEGVGALVTLCSAAKGTSLVLNYLEGLIDGARAEGLLELVDQALESLFGSFCVTPLAIGGSSAPSPSTSDSG